ncbi:TPA: site-specific DNA-methyltransferase [Vibrio vulnificus]|nr:site-specific DNA-methyltransferase [Vibrio vulnificus]
MNETKPEQVVFQGVSSPYCNTYHTDARDIPVSSSSVDLIVTSPPYWKKRDYGYDGQIGQEKTPNEFVSNIIDCMSEWKRVLKSTGSVFLNIGDSYVKKTLAGVPARLEIAALDNGWKLRNRIVWSKSTGMPDPAKNRLANRNEVIFHFVKSDRYYYDLHNYSNIYGNGSNPGDVWNMKLQRNNSRHLAPFPEELVERAIHLACPRATCPVCGHIPTRVIQRSAELDPSRPQAKRAMELAVEKGLTEAHIAAIQSTGISDAGKALQVQVGTGRNRDEVKKLAAEAKMALGGYFREFTFAKKKTAGWSDCNCGKPLVPGVVLDPFMGTGTTLRVANSLNRSALGIDLAPKDDDHVWGQVSQNEPQEWKKVAQSN